MLCIKHNEIPQPPNFLYLIFGVGKMAFLFFAQKSTHTKNLTPMYYSMKK